MPTRVIRDGILTSERVNALSERAELFYRRLMSVVDDYGRFTANPTLLRAACYPLKLDSVKEDSIKKHLAEAADAGLIVLYTVAGKAYLEMQDFGQRVQGKPKYPANPGDSPESTVTHGESREKTAIDEDGDEDEDAVEGDTPKPPVGGVTGPVVAAYHELLPACRRVEVMNPKREKRIQAADKLARKVCAQQGWPYSPQEFWGAYFTECQADPWLRGDVADPKNPRWKQNLDVLIREDRFAEIMDSAISKMRAAA